LLKIHIGPHEEVYVPVRSGQPISVIVLGSGSKRRRS